MTSYPTAVFLSVGDALTPSGNDVVPASGDYLNLLDPTNYIIEVDGLDIPPPDPQNGDATSGAAQRIKATSVMANRVITLNLLVIGKNMATNTGTLGSVWDNVSNIEYKMEQARAASGPMGHGTGIVLMVRYATNDAGQTQFTFFDVLDGRLTEIKRGTHNVRYRGFKLELYCLPYGRLNAATWPSPGSNTSNYSANLDIGNNSSSQGHQLYIGNISPSSAVATAAVTTLYPLNSTAHVGSFLGGWNQTAPGYRLQQTLSLIAPSAGTVQSASTSYPTSLPATNTTTALAIFVSPYLNAGTVSAGNWTIGFAISAANTASATMKGFANVLLINGSTGAIRTTIIGTNAVGASRNCDGTEKTCWSNVVAGASFTSVAGDWIQIELGVDITFSGSAPTSASVYWNGATAITADSATTADARAFVTAPGSFTLIQNPPVYSLAGDAGSLAQIHIWDKSTGASTINRVRIGRRSVPGPNGGMGSTDWVGVYNHSSALGSATVHSAFADAYGADFVQLIMATTQAFQPVARFRSPIGGVAPLYSQGVYDVWVRARDHTVVALPPTINSLTTSNIVVVSNGALPPDTYTVKLVGQFGGGTSTSQPTAAATISTSYPQLPDVYFNDFETGDTTGLIVEEDDGSATVGAAGTTTVISDAAVSGQYGLQCTADYFFSAELEFEAVAPGPPPTITGEFVQQRLKHRVVRNFAVSSPSTTGAWIGCWVNLNGAQLAHGGSLVSILSFESSAQQTANPQTGWSGITPGSQTPAFHQFGIYQGNVVDIVITNAGSFNLRVMQTTTSVSFYSFTSPSTLPPLTALFQEPMFIAIHISVANPSGAFTCTGYVSTAGGAFSTGSVAGNTSGTSSVYVDRACFGIAAAYGSGLYNINYDDIMIGSDAVPISSFCAGPVIAVNYTDPNSTTPQMYVQQGQQDYRFFTAAGTLSIANGFYVADSATVPSTASPTPMYLQGRVGVDGTSVNSIATTPVPTSLQNTQWAFVNLGTLTLPPLAQFEGLNPNFGTGNGGFAWQLDVYAQSYGGSDQIDIDAIWLFPHEEPQIVAEYPGLGSTTAYEWVIDTRRDGRAGTLLRSTSDRLTQVGSANTIGHMRFAPGNQALLFMFESENGVSVLSGLSAAVQLRMQPQTHYLSDESVSY